MALKNIKKQSSSYIEIFKLRGNITMPHLIELNESPFSTNFLEIKITPNMRISHQRERPKYVMEQSYFKLPKLPPSRQVQERMCYRSTFDVSNLRRIDFDFDFDCWCLVCAVAAPAVLEFFCVHFRARIREYLAGKKLGWAGLTMRIVS